MPSRSGTPSCSRSSRARTGAGAMSTKPMSEQRTEPGAREHEPALEFSEDLPETPDLHGAYPRLDDAQIPALSALGQRRATQPGDILFREGDRNCDFFVVVAGKVTAVEGHGTPEEHVISVHGHGRFLGELNLLTGEGSFSTRDR